MSAVAHVLPAGPAAVRRPSPGRERVPLQRFRQFEDAAALACFLTFDDDAWIAGQTVVLDGGTAGNNL